jgi:hypothetical protein
MQASLAMFLNRKLRIEMVYYVGFPQPTEKLMNLDKSKKRIAKKSKMGFQGYPKISIVYYGKTANFADEVMIEFVSEEGADIQTERFTSKIDVREDEIIQSALVKMIERADAKTVVQANSVLILS